MRKASEITRDLKVARDYNHANSAKMTGAEQRELSATVRKLQQELSDLYSAGAGPCAKCKSAPLGMDRATRFEVGCTRCPPIAVEVEAVDTEGNATKVTRRLSYSSQGRTPEEAVDNWNAGIYLIDDKLDLIPKSA